MALLPCEFCHASGTEHLRHLRGGRNTCRSILAKTAGGLIDKDFLCPGINRIVKVEVNRTIDRTLAIIEIWGFIDTEMPCSINVPDTRRTDDHVIIRQQMLFII